MVDVGRKTAGVIQLLVGAGLGALALWRLRALEVPFWHEGIDLHFILVEALMGAAGILFLLGAWFVVDGFLRDAKVRRFFPEASRDAIAVKVGEAEKRTSGEIRVVVRVRRSFPERFRGLGVEDLALREFGRLGLERTRDRTGVLLLVLLSRRQFRILGDTGIHEKIGQATWDGLAARISADAAREGIGNAVAKGLGEIGDLLAAHFPRKSDDTNELSDEVAIR